MAPSSGHLMASKATRILRFALDKANIIIRSKLPASSTTAGNTALQPIHLYTQTQPIHPLVQFRQSRSQQQRWFSKTTHNANPASSTGGQYNRSSFPVSKTSKAIARSGAAPFASTLRPSLTGGALPRTAGGYSLGGSGRHGVRHFSHTPSAQAQVVQNVSASIRAFVVGGGKARYDGVDKRTGAKRYRAVTKTQDQVLEKLSKPTPAFGSSLELRLSPTITALCPSLSSVTTTTLNTPALLSTLSTDFARALRDLALTLNDLRRLASLGDLPLTLTYTTTGPVLVVRFPGCDAKSVECLCDEVGVKRGVVREDEGWRNDKGAEMALLFPFASSSEAVSEVGDNYLEKGVAAKRDEVEWRHMLSPRAEIRPVTTLDELLSDMISTELVSLNPILMPLEDPEGYESLRGSDFGSEGAPVYGYHHHPHHQSYNHDDIDLNPKSSERAGSEEYEGLEGIYKFLTECDEVRR